MMDSKALAEGMLQLGIAPGPMVIDRLLKYLDLLGEWSQAYNLVGSGDRSNMVARHLLDSLSIVPYLQEKRVLDVGSGGGLPAFPVAIACPELAVTSIDSRRKKTEFQRYAAHKLELENIEIICGRVETYRPEQNFDTLACRAYSSLEKFVRQSVSLCMPGGRLLAMKGAHPGTELEALDKGMVTVLDVVPVNVPGLEAERCIVLMEPTGRNRTRE